MLKMTVSLKFNDFEKIGEEAEKKLDKIIRKTAFDIEARAKAGAPVDTGALRASIHVCTSSSSNYAQAVARAKAAAGRSAFKQAKVRVSRQYAQQGFGSAAMSAIPTGAAVNAADNLEIFPEIKPANKLEALVAVAVEYGVYVEMGTIRMPARSFFAPAVEAVRPDFERAIAGLLS